MQSKFQAQASTIMSRNGSRLEEAEVHGTTRLSRRCCQTHHQFHRTTMSSDMKKTKKVSWLGSKTLRKCLRELRKIKLDLEIMKLKWEWPLKDQLNGWCQLKSPKKWSQYNVRREETIQVQATTKIQRMVSCLCTSTTDRACSHLECKEIVNRQPRSIGKLLKKYKMKSAGWWQQEGLMQRMGNIHQLKEFLTLQVVFKTYLRVIVTVMVLDLANTTSRVKALSTQEWSQNDCNSSVQLWNDSLIIHQKWNQVLRLDQDTMNKSQARRVALEFRENKYLVLKSTLVSQPVRIVSMMRSLPKTKPSTLWHQAQVLIKPRKTSLMHPVEHGARMECSGLQRGDSCRKEISPCTRQDQELTSNQTWLASKLSLQEKLREAAQCSYPRPKGTWRKSQLKTQDAKLSLTMISYTQ